MGGCGELKPGFVLCNVLQATPYGETNAKLIIRRPRPHHYSTKNNHCRHGIWTPIEASVGMDRQPLTLSV